MLLCCWQPQDGDGALRYAEFVSGLLYVNAKVSAVETARLTFRLFDKVRAQRTRPNVELPNFGGRQRGTRSFR